MRYGVKVLEIGVGLGDLDLKAPEALARLKRSFEARHEELYAYHLPEQQPVLVNARVATVGVLPELPSEPAVAAQRHSSVKGRRKIYLGEWVDAEIHAFPELADGQTINGPALVESETTTVLLSPADRGTVTGQGWLDIRDGR